LPAIFNVDIVKESKKIHSRHFSTVKVKILLLPQISQKFFFNTVNWKLQGFWKSDFFVPKRIRADLLKWAHKALRRLNTPKGTSPPQRNIKHLQPWAVIETGGIIESDRVSGHRHKRGEGLSCCRTPFLCPSRSCLLPALVASKNNLN